VSGDVIKLEFPARPEYILAVRLVVSAIAERGGFGIEDIEDLKVASAEACILLMDASPETLDIRITVGEGISLELTAVGQRSGAATAASEEGLSQYLLEALVDSCDIKEENGVVKAVSFAKRP
jgi:serine/threonine-protein kinase RsbW